MIPTKQQLRIRRHNRLRALVKGSSSRPRVSVFKSNQYIYAQVVDDISRATLLSLSDMKLKPSATVEKGGIKERKAYALGESLGSQLKEKGIKVIVFDRGGFKYHGRVKAIAEGIRQAGITF